MPRPRSRTRFQELRRVFNSASSDEFDELLARLVVLYEDLRVEFNAMTADKIPEIDDPGLGEKYRRLYFLRRSVATLLELSGALKGMNECPSFKEFRSRSASPAKWERWDRAVCYFEDSGRHELLKKIRNEVGGHFQRRAARHAVSELRPGLIGKLEFTVSPSGRGGAKLHFASELAATATLRHLPGKNTAERSQQLVQDVVREGFEYATSGTNALIANYLWGRFGK